MSLISRHFKNSLAWDGFTPCDLACALSASGNKGTTGIYEGSYKILSKLEIPKTVQFVYIDGFQFIVVNSYTPKLKYHRLIKAWEYIAWPVSDFTGKIIAKESFTAASGLPTGTTEIVKVNNMKVAELPDTSALINETGHTVNVYQFITTTPRSNIVLGSILEYKAIKYRIIDLRRFLDVWVIMCSLG